MYIVVIQVQTKNNYITQFKPRMCIYVCVEGAGGGGGWIYLKKKKKTTYKLKQNIDQNKIEKKVEIKGLILIV